MNTKKKKDRIWNWGNLNGTKRPPPSGKTDKRGEPKARLNIQHEPSPRSGCCLKGKRLPEKRWARLEKEKTWLKRFQVV